ncbi:hypothetical protein [Nocardia vermiculata]|uniref:Uncharacterized protein n=1 Tax=Nocardia vermiculata TaxID=257274 RepID=A0A846Y9G4_9NOCA|nr:hypothetical protein [Nocardia vermiculata]NKY54460.1 hypothetical protein [Nocardia vermiculata]
MLISITEAVPRAAQALADGKPVVPPLPYAIFGIGPGIVNGAKGRPADQPAGIVIADIAAVTPFLGAQLQPAANHSSRISWEPPHSVSTTTRRASVGRPMGAEQLARGGR